MARAATSIGRSGAIIEADIVVGMRPSPCRGRASRPARSPRRRARAPAPRPGGAAGLRRLHRSWLCLAPKALEKAAHRAHHGGNRRKPDVRPGHQGCGDLRRRRQRARARRPRRDRRQDRRDRRQARRGQGDGEGRRAGAGARHHRRPHPLRRADHLGSLRRSLAGARRHHGGDGQLRLHHRALQARRPRPHHAPPHPRRGHVARRAARRHPLGLRELPAISRHAAEPGRRPQRRLLRRPFGDPHLRDGRGGNRAHRDRRRDRAR